MQMPAGSLNIFSNTEINSAKIIMRHILGSINGLSSMTPTTEFSSTTPNLYTGQRDVEWMRFALKIFISLFLKNHFYQFQMPSDSLLIQHFSI